MVKFFFYRVLITLSFVWQHTCFMGAPQTRSIIIDRLQQINTQRSNSTQCSIRKSNVVFLKVHKAGSTTVQNILLRHAFENNLNVALPKWHLDSLSFHVIGNEILRTSLIPLPDGEEYNILCNHIVYNRELLGELMPKDTQYIGIVRDPMTQFLSSAKYFQFFSVLQRDTEDKSIANDLDKLTIDYIHNSSRYPKIDKQDITEKIHNYQSNDFGLKKEDFDNDTAINSLLSKIENEFQIIMLTEYFDESLILLRRYLCWDFSDILYITKNVQGALPMVLYNPIIKAWLKKHNMADFRLYNHMRSRFWNQVAAEGGSFHDEVTEFKFIKKKVSDFCFRNKEGELFIEKSQWNEEFHITMDDCRLLRYDERQIVCMMMFRQAEKVNLTIAEKARFCHVNEN